MTLPRVVVDCSGWIEGWGAPRSRQPQRIGLEAILGDGDNDFDDLVIGFNFVALA